MLRPLIAPLAVLCLAALAATPLEAQQRGGRASGHRPARQQQPGEPTGPNGAPQTASPGSSSTLPPGPLPGVSLDRVVAIVNDGIVTESELEDEIADVTQRAQQQGRKLPPPDEVRNQVVDYLVSREVQLQRADRVGLKVSDEQLNATMADLAKSNNLTLSQLPDVMAGQGIDYASYREDTRKKILLAMLQQREVESKINVTPRELDQFIERLKKLPGEKDEYDISDILIAIPTDANQAKVDELSKKAQEVYERALKEDFAQLAAAYSNATTALDGGALGWRPGANLPTDLAETIVSLKPGEVSKPFMVAPYGFHIVKLNGKRSAEADPVQDQVHVRHILMKPNTLQDDATVSLKLADIRRKVLDGQDFAAFASSLSEDKNSTVDGGLLEWASPEVFVRPFGPEFSQAIAGLKDGEISAPFQSRDGWHIVQLLGRRKFDTTEDALRERAFVQLRDSKAEEETELWLRHLRDDAFIDTNL